MHGKRIKRCAVRTLENGPIAMVYAVLWPDCWEVGGLWSARSKGQTASRSIGVSLMFDFSRSLHGSWGLDWLVGVAAGICLGLWLCVCGRAMWNA